MAVKHGENSKGKQQYLFLLLTLVILTTFCSVVVETLFSLGRLLYCFNVSINCAREMLKVNGCFLGNLCMYEMSHI